MLLSITLQFPLDLDNTNIPAKDKLCFFNFKTKRLKKVDMGRRPGMEWSLQNRQGLYVVISVSRDTLMKDLAAVYWLAL